MSLDLDGVLGQHEILPGFRDLSIHCGCGWVGPERHGLPTHRAHVAAVLRAEVGRWLGSEGARLAAAEGVEDYAYPGLSVIECERAAKSALAALAEQAAQVAPSRVPGEGS